MVETVRSVKLKAEIVTNKMTYSETFDLSSYQYDTIEDLAEAVKEWLENTLENI